MARRWRKKFEPEGEIIPIDWNWGDPLPFDGEAQYRMTEDPAYALEVYDYLHDTWIKAKRGWGVCKGSKGEFYPNEALLQDYVPIEEDGHD